MIIEDIYFLKKKSMKLSLHYLLGLHFELNEY